MKPNHKTEKNKQNKKPKPQTNHSTKNPQQNNPTKTKQTNKTKPKIKPAKLEWKSLGKTQDSISFPASLLWFLPLLSCYPLFLLVLLLVPNSSPGCLFGSSPSLILYHLYPSVAEEANGFWSLECYAFLIIAPQS